MVSTRKSSAAKSPRKSSSKASSRKKASTPRKVSTKRASAKKSTAKKATKKRASTKKSSTKKSSTKKRASTKAASTKKKSSTRKRASTKTVVADDDDNDNEDDYFPSTQDLHFKRKFFHAFGSTGALLYWRYMSFDTALAASAAFFAMFIFLDVGRMYSPAIGAFVRYCMSPVIRVHELNNLSGSFYTFMSMFFLTLLFERPIVVLSWLYLSLGDPFASTVGLLFHPRTVPRLSNGKSVVAGAANFVLCFTISMLFFLYVYVPSGLYTSVAPATPTPTTALAFIAALVAGPSAWNEFMRVVVVSLVGSAASAGAELAVSNVRPRPFPMDDNFVIPLVSAMCLKAVMNQLPF